LRNVLERIDTTVTGANNIVELMNAMGNVRSTGGSFRATDQATPVETAAQNPELQATEPVKSPAPFAGNTITLEAHLSEGISKANIELQGLLSPKSNAKNKGQLIENIRARISNLEQQLQTAKQGGTNGLLTPTTNGTSEAGTAGPVGVETGPEVANAQGGAGTAANAGPNGKCHARHNRIRSLPRGCLHSRGIK